MYRISAKKLYLCLTGLVLLVICASCSSVETKPEAPAATTFTYYVHTVKWRNELLATIANWYTGDQQNWKILAAENPDINPNVIYSGTKIRIPEKLIKTKAPMTKEYVDNFYAKTRKEPVWIPPAQGREDKPDLFGPKGSK